MFGADTFGSSYFGEAYSGVLSSIIYRKSNAPTGYSISSLIPSSESRLTPPRGEAKVSTII